MGSCDPVLAHLSLRELGIKSVKNICCRREVLFAHIAVLGKSRAPNLLVKREPWRLIWIIEMSAGAGSASSNH